MPGTVQGIEDVHKNKYTDKYLCLTGFTDIHRITAAMEGQQLCTDE